MSLTPYRRVLSRPGVLRLLLVATLARVPVTAAGVVLTLHVVLTLRLGYAAAGLVATAATVGMAIGAPWRGRAVDRLGLRRALVPSIVAEAAVWGSAPFVGYRLLLAVAFAGGVLGLPIFAVARQSLSCSPSPVSPSSPCCPDGARCASPAARRCRTTPSRSGRASAEPERR